MKVVLMYSTRGDWWSTISGGKNWMRRWLIEPQSDRGSLGWQMMSWWTFWRRVMLKANWRSLVKIVETPARRKRATKSLFKENSLPPCRSLWTNTWKVVDLKEGAMQCFWNRRYLTNQILGGWCSTLQRVSWANTSRSKKKIRGGGGPEEISLATKQD